MIAPFRTAIWTLGSGSILIAAVVFSRDELPRRQFAANRVAPVVITDASLTGNAVRIESPSDRTLLTSTLVSHEPPARPYPVFQNASLRTAGGGHGPSLAIAPPMPTQSAEKGTAAVLAQPVVVLKPDERPIAVRTQKSAPTSEKSLSPATKMYRPRATGVPELERLIRPLLTPGLGTAVANRNAAAGEAPDILLVRDRPEVLSQIDAIFSNLEATPARVVVDTLIAEIALPDSTPPGWELGQSHFGVIDAEPKAVFNSLRSIGRVSVIATNQLQVIDRQWAELEWTERTCPTCDPAAPPRLATKIRIRPTVLSSGLIRLEVHPTSSRLKESPSAPPELATVVFTTDIVLHAGSTALIAGSVDERTRDAESGFSPGNTSPQPGLRHECILLLRPRISQAN